MEMSMRSSSLASSRGGGGGQGTPPGDVQGSVLVRGGDPVGFAEVDTGVGGVLGQGGGGGAPGVAAGGHGGGGAAVLPQLQRDVVQAVLVGSGRVPAHAAAAAARSGGGGGGRGRGGKARVEPSRLGEVRVPAQAVNGHPHAVEGG